MKTQYFCVNCKGCQGRIGSNVFTCDYRRTEDKPLGEQITHNVWTTKPCKDFIPEHYVDSINFDTR